MGKALDAKLRAVDRNGLRIFPIDREKFRQILAALDVLGELKANPRLGDILLDGVVDQAKAVLSPQPLVLLPHLRIFGNRKADLQSIQCRPPERSVLESTTEHC